MFPTAEEAEYPWLLCERIISCLESFGVSQGLTWKDSLQMQASDPLAPVECLALGKQPKGNKLRPLLNPGGAVLVHHFVGSFGISRIGAAGDKDSYCAHVPSEMQSRCKQIRQTALDAFVRENVVNFPEALLCDALGDLSGINFLSSLL